MSSSAADDVLSGYLLLALLPLLLLIFLRPRLQQKLRRNEAPPPLRLPPGPWRLPVIGSLHHLIMNPLKHRVLADLARRCDAPVMYLRLGELDAVVVSSPDAAREVMKTHDVNFASRPLNATARVTAAHGLGVVMTPYGERWRQLRKVCSLELLSAKRVRSFRPIREDETAQLVADIAARPPGGDPVNITERLATLLTDSSFRAIMGERFKHRDEFLESLTQMVKIAAGFNVRDMFPSSRLMCAISGTVRKSRAFHRKIFQLIDYAINQHGERKATGGAAATTASGEDMIDVLLRIQKEDSLDYSSLSIGTIKAVILDLFAGGSDTTTTTINWAIGELMRNPSVLRKAQDEVWQALQGKSRVTEDDLAKFRYLKLVIKETLRLHPAAPLLIPRECQEPCKILGYDVPKGAYVFVNAWAIGRDPKYWDEPETFEPERFEGVGFDYSGTDFRYIPFGAGRRMCPGSTFALANLELLLATLMFHFEWKLPDGVTPSDVDLTEEMGITVRPKRDLYMHATVRVPLPAEGALA